jgi:hypothetical protein
MRTVLHTKPGVKQKLRRKRCDHEEIGMQHGFVRYSLKSQGSKAVAAIS